MKSEPPVLHDVAPSQWQDMNGHMNIAYYTILVTRFLDLLTEWGGFGAGYRDASGASLFVVELRTLYRRELREGERVKVTGAFTGAAAKRLNVACAILAGDALAAEAEVAFVNVDLATRRSRAFTAQALERARSLVAVS
jgi:acyl-CoA thioester hydrolase